MKLPLSFMLLLYTGICFAQDTIYYKKPRLRVSSFEQCDYFGIVTKDADHKITEIDYSRLEMQKSEKHYFIGGKEKIKTENWKVWDSMGNLQRSLNYEKGKLNGNLITYWPNGHIKRNDLFKDDVLVKGVCYDSAGNQLAHFPYKVPATFPGGTTALDHFIKRTLHYPQTSGPVGGVVTVRFLITRTGSIRDIKVLNNPYEPMKEEVLRVLKKMPQWEPEKIDGEPIDSYYTLPVHFIAN